MIMYVHIHMYIYIYDLGFSYYSMNNNNVTFVEQYSFIFFGVSLYSRCWSSFYNWQNMNLRLHTYHDSRE